MLERTLHGGDRSGKPVGHERYPHDGMSGGAECDGDEDDEIDVARCHLAGMAGIGSLAIGAGPKAAVPTPIEGPAREAAVASARPDLVAARLTRARLPCADLRGANLIGANLAQAHLVAAHLEHANLSGANLTEAHLIGVELRGANLVGACLAGAGLTGADLTSALYDDSPRWPDGFDPARHGARIVEDRSMGESSGRRKPRPARKSAAIRPSGAAAQIMPRPIAWGEPCLCRSR